MLTIFSPSRLALAREARGLTQEQLADKMSVKRQQIGQWERGEVKPGADFIAQLSTALQTPVAFFFVNGGADGASLTNQNDAA